MHSHVTRRSTQSNLIISASVVACMIASLLATRIAAAQAGTTYYVSKGGNNADGRSWATAWDELDKINWDVIQPGDTIFLDGGATRMVYTSSLVIGKSGTASAPITIKTATETGRNGKVIIFGGRSTPLPYCDQPDYYFQTEGVRTIGIIFAMSWVIVDGGKWRGITIYGHNKYGVSLNGSSSHVTLRNVEIYDNGTALQTNGLWHSDRPGVNLSGAYNTVERAIIHDNGQDAFQSGGGVSNFTLRDSWLYNSRPLPGNPERMFNACAHSDGIQIFAGGTQSGILIEDSVIGPGFMQGLILGQTPNSAGQHATINDVTIRNALFYKSTNANIMDHNRTGAVNWTIENVTSYRGTGSQWHNVYYSGTGLTIRNSIFQGGLNMSVPNGTFTSNCQWQVGKTTVGQTIDPQFADVSGDNYTLRPDSPCAGKGANITSPTQLVGRDEALIQPPAARAFMPFLSR